MQAPMETTGGSTIKIGGSILGQNSEDQKGSASSLDSACIHSTHGYLSRWPDVEAFRPE